MTKLIDSNDFVKVKNGSLAEDGIKKGTEFFIAGHLMVPLETSKDGYDYRKCFVGALIEGDHINIEKRYLIDAKGLTKVSPKREAELKKAMETDDKLKESCSALLKEAKGE